VSDGLQLTLPPEQLVELEERIAARVLAQLTEQGAGPSPWLDAQGAADHLGFKLKRIRNLTAARAIPFHRQGHRVRYRRDELDEWLDGQREGRSA
jgi:excisionase family DNA binding protein